MDDFNLNNMDCFNVLSNQMFDNLNMFGMFLQDMDLLFDLMNGFLHNVFNDVFQLVFNSNDCSLFDNMMKFVQSVFQFQISFDDLFLSNSNLSLRSSLNDLFHHGDFSNHHSSNNNDSSNHGYDNSFHNDQSSNDSNLHDFGNVLDNLNLNMVWFWFLTMTFWGNLNLFPMSFRSLAMFFTFWIRSWGRSLVAFWTSWAD